MMKRMTYISLLMPLLMVLGACSKIEYQREQLEQVPNHKATMYAWLGQPYTDVQRQCEAYIWAQAEDITDVKIDPATNKPLLDPSGDTIMTHISSFTMPHYYKFHDKHQDFMVRVVSDEQNQFVKKVIYSQVHESTKVFDTRDLDGIYYDFEQLTADYKQFYVKMESHIVLENGTVGSPEQIGDGTPFGVSYFEGHEAFSKLILSLGDHPDVKELYQKFELSFGENLAGASPKVTRKVCYEKVFQKARDGKPGLQTTVFEMVVE